MPIQNVSTIYIGPRSQRLITFIGVVIGMSWVGVSIAAAISGRGLPPEENPAFVWYAVGLHPYSKGFIPMQLLTYSFIHDLGWHLIGNLIMLVVLVWISRDCLSPSGFIRLYSLGSVCGGLVFLLMSLPMETRLPMIGAGTALMAMLGALAVMKPKMELTLLLIIIPIRTRLVWVAVFILVSQLLGLKENPSLSLGMVSGLFVGVLYSIVEKLWIQFGK